MRLLLVEDDMNLGRATASGLSEAYAVDWFQTADEASLAITTTTYDLAVLDINLPDGSGLQLLAKWRGQGKKLPVLLLTARSSVAQRVEGLNLGADDYLTKPFDLDELLARCAALVRRTHNRATPEIKVGEVVFIPQEGKLTLKGKPIELSARERAILEVLMAKPGKIINRQQIEERIYAWSDDSPSSNSIEVHIASLRRKLGKNFIKTYRGQGYCVC